jgi:hypothetical protein
MAASVTSIDPNLFQIQSYQSSQVNLIPSFNLDTFLSTNSKIEYVVLDSNKNLLQLDPDFKNYQLSTEGNSQPGIISSIILDPEKDLLDRGFSLGQYVTYYNFIFPKIGSSPTSLFIKEISPDRTELRLDSIELDLFGIIEQTSAFVLERENTPYFIDWQYIANGKGVQDIVFFMIESFSIENINKYMDIFLLILS